MKKPVLLLLFRVEEVVSDAPEEGLSIGYRFKNINDSFWVSGCGGLLLTSHESWQASQGLQSTWLAAQGGLPRQGGAKEIKPRSQLRGSSPSPRGGVGISAGERDIVKVFPEEKIYIKSNSILCFFFIGIDLREGIYWAYSHL